MKSKVDGHSTAPLCSCFRKTRSQAQPLRRRNHLHDRRRPADGQRPSANFHGGRQATDDFRCAADMSMRIDRPRKNIKAACVDYSVRFWERNMNIQHASDLSVFNDHIGVLSPVMGNHLAAGNEKIDGVHLFSTFRRAV